MDASRHISGVGPQGFVSLTIDRNATIFGYSMSLLQIGLSLIYGFLITVPSVQLNISSVIITSGLAILVIAGFGLVFGYTKRMAWSGIGFTFFITALCIELYPLINDFWTKVGLQSNSPPTDFSYSNRQYNLFLSDRETGVSGQTPFYGNSITNSLKCALSIVVAFSCVLGRVGHLQCLIVTLVGTVGFELNRQIVQQNQGTDTFGTFYIFTFGGFMGLGISAITFIRQQNVLNKINRFSMLKYTGSQFSTLLAIFGGLIIFALFPLLAYQIDAYSRYSNYSPYTNPVCIIIGLGTGAVSSIMTSALLNGYIIARDAIHGPIAGAIVVGASSLYITNPLYAFIAGICAGIIQAFIQNFIQKKTVKKRWIISTVSWSLFGFQGIIGACFAAGWKAIVFTQSNSMGIEAATLAMTSQFQFYGGLISAGIGAAFGLGIGAVIYPLNGHKPKQYFEDFYYWHTNDGLRYDIPAPEPKPVPPILAKPPPSQPKIQQPQVFEQPPRRPPSELIPVPQVEIDREQQEFDISLASSTVGNPYAYL